MTEQNKEKDEAGRADPSVVGDVEAAGETTAAATTGGSTAPAKPVGAGTRVRVEGDPPAAGSDE